MKLLIKILKHLLNILLMIVKNIMIYLIDLLIKKENLCMTKNIVNWGITNFHEIILREYY